MSSIQLGSDALAGSPASGQVEYNGQMYYTDSNASRAQVERLVLSTAQTASGTSITFTGIPAWAKRITFMFQSLASSSSANIQLGTSGGLVTTGYLGAVINENSTNNTVSNLSSGFSLQTIGTTPVHGIYTFVNISGNNWMVSGTFGYSTTSLIGYISGSIALPSVLTQMNVTGTFSSGSVNILYEG